MIDLLSLSVKYLIHTAPIDTVRMSPCSPMSPYGRSTVFDNTSGYFDSWCLSFLAVISTRIILIRCLLSIYSYNCQLNINRYLMRLKESWMNHYPSFRKNDLPYLYRWKAYPTQAMTYCRLLYSPSLYRFWLIMPEKYKMIFKNIQ